MLPPWVRRTSSPMSSIGVPDGQQQHGQEVLDLPVAQRLDVRIVGRALDAAVPAQVVVGAVAVVLAVRLVVLPVVRDQVVQREAVVAGDEVDALLRLPLLVAVQVRAAEQPRREPPRPCRRRPSRSAARRRGTGRSTPATCRRRSCPPGTAPPRPRPRRSAWCRPAPDPTRCPTAPAGSRSGWPGSSRDRIDARSNRNPSTCICVDPVAQAVLDHAAHDRLVGVERVAAAGEVRVARLVGLRGCSRTSLASPR